MVLYFNIPVETLFHILKFGYAKKIKIRVQTFVNVIKFVVHYSNNSFLFLCYNIHVLRMEILLLCDISFSGYSAVAESFSTGVIKMSALSFKNFSFAIAEISDNTFTNKFSIGIKKLMQAYRNRR